MEQKRCDYNTSANNVSYLIFKRCYIKLKIIILLPYRINSYYK